MKKLHTGIDKRHRRSTSSTYTPNNNQLKKYVEIGEERYKALTSSVLMVHPQIEQQSHQLVLQAVQDLRGIFDSST